MYVETEPLARLYAHAEALRTTADGLQAEQGGLALILSLQADDIERLASRMDNEGWQPKPKDPPH